MTLSGIDRSAILKSIEEFDRLGRYSFLERYGFARSQSYFLLYSNKLYDSKAIVGVANRYSGEGQIALRAAEFSGGEATVAQLLRHLDFEVRITADAAHHDILDKAASQDLTFWWVNHKQTFAQEVEGNYLWSPTTKSDGRRNEFYENMKRVRPGDVVFSFAGGEIKAIGTCMASAILAQKPSEFGSAGAAWINEGWKVAVEFSRLDIPLRPKDHMVVLAPALPEKYSPIQTNGNGNQGAYLAAVPISMAQLLIDLLGSQWLDLNALAVVDHEKKIEAFETSEEEGERAIRNRTDLQETEKLQLVRSRRGQGIYRSNLEGFEQSCRITQVTNLRHLRASHIKPWRVSTNFEKLDGNNGLLLSPHIDHLFDQGYISFEDDGMLIISAKADPETLTKWGISSEGKFDKFRAEQLPYLAFHREFVFKF